MNKELCIKVGKWNNWNMQFPNPENCSDKETCIAVYWNMQWQIETCTDIKWNLQWHQLTFALTQTETCGAANRSIGWLNLKKCSDKLKNVVTSSETCTYVNWNMSWLTGTCNVINWISSGWGISSCAYMVPKSGLRRHKTPPLSLSGIVEPQVFKALNDIIISFTFRSSQFSVPSRVWG